MDGNKLEQVISLVRNDLPAVPKNAIEDFITADWPEGQEHLDWLDNAPVDEIVSWAVIGLKDWDFSEAEE